MLYSTAGCFLASCACIQPESLGCALSCLVELQFHLLWLPSRERTQSSKMLLDPSERKQEHSGHLEVKVRTPSLSSEQVHTNDAVSTTDAHLAGLFKKLQTVTPVCLAAHLTLHIDKKEQLMLRALRIPSVLQDISYPAK